MSKNIKEVTHKTSGGIDGQYVALGLLTAGMGFCAPPEPTKHEVVVKDDKGNYGGGSGKTHGEARQNAISNLSSGRKK